MLGPVTISSDYKQFSRSLIMGFVRRHYWDENWAEFVRPRKRFAFEEKRVDAEALLEGAGDDVKRLDQILADIERSRRGGTGVAQEILAPECPHFGLQPRPQIQRRIGRPDAARRAGPARRNAGKPPARIWIRLKAFEKGCRPLKA